MEVEASRLATFENWPQNAPVEPVQLAKNGFYATGEFLEAQCHWCRAAIRDWDYGDKVEDRHRKIAPHCPFVVNLHNCGNVPLFLATAPPERDMFNEEYRLATFKNWPNANISPKTLAKAGFFYLNRSDEVKCAWCLGVIAKWMAGDDAFVEHQRLFPDCPRAKLGPLLTVSDGLGDLCIQPAKAPKNPKYASLDARLGTYTNWPMTHTQEPNLLARAGLYFQGFDDQVRCFHCNIGLHSWQQDDDPLAEHAKWSPDCHFVRLVLGCNPAPVSSNIEQQQQQTQGTSSELGAAAFVELPTSTSRLSAATVALPSEVETLHKEANPQEINANKIPTKEPNAESSSKMSLEEEHRHLKEARLCKVCLDEEVGVVFLPCGHLVTCFQCAPSITDCPICRAAIKGVVRAYLS